ncbi:MAG: cell division protein CrgA, partial [Nitriliruptorales bacterium]|nr:cell division protein CrgA [Nitriliruptorales bacterium]
NPEPSPTWVPATGASLLGLGVLVILLGYLKPVAEVTSAWPGLQSNWPLVIGFVMLAAGFGFLTRWQ